MRGLTHRAVDRAAGLPEGSTSYYLRTRQALLEAVVARLSTADMADMARHAQHAVPDEFVERLAQLVEYWLTAGRERMLARYEVALESTRRPELRAALLESGERLRAYAEAELTRAGAEEPARRARDLTAYLDGFIFDQLAGAGTRRLTAADLRAAMRDLLRGVLG